MAAHSGRTHGIQAVGSRMYVAWWRVAQSFVNGCVVTRVQSVEDRALWHSVRARGSLQRVKHAGLVALTHEWVLGFRDAPLYCVRLFLGPLSLTILPAPPAALVSSLATKMTAMLLPEAKFSSQMLSLSVS